MDDGKTPPPRARGNESVSRDGSRAERLLALRAPLIERGKRVPALETSIAAHEVEARALRGLLHSAALAEKALISERDDALADARLQTLETNLVRERLRAAEGELADVKDSLHVQAVAHEEEVAANNARLAHLQRRIDDTVAESAKKIDQLNFALKDSRQFSRSELAKLRSDRDQCKADAAQAREELNAMAKQSKKGSAFAAFEAEKARSKSLQQQLEEAQRVSQAAASLQEQLSAAQDELKTLRDSKRGSAALQAQRKHASLLRKQLEDAQAAAAAAMCERDKMQKKCEQMERMVLEGQRRGETIGARVARLQRGQPEDQHTYGSPSGGGLMSPAPLAFSKRRPAEDVASESRSRFTNTLPFAIEEDGGGTPRRARVPLPFSPGRTTRRPESDGGKGTSSPSEARSEPPAPDEAGGGVQTRKRRRSKSDGPGQDKSDADHMQDIGSTEPETPRGIRARLRSVSTPPVTPQRNERDGPERNQLGAKEQERAERGGARTQKRTINREQPARQQAGGKTKSSDDAEGKKKRGYKRKQEEANRNEKHAEGVGVAEPARQAPGGRTLRSRRPVSYNYDTNGRDIVNMEPGFEVDTKALRKVPATRSRKGAASGKAKVVRQLVLNDDALNNKAVQAKVRKQRVNKPAARKRIRLQQSPS